MSSRLLIMTLGLITAAVQGSSPQELTDLDRLQREIRLVRDFTADLQAEYSEAAPVRFRYEDVIRRLDTLERDIDAHIEYVTGRPKRERFGE